MMKAFSLAKQKPQLIVLAVVLMASFFSLFYSTNTAFAADATWKDKKTISYGGKEFKGPVTPADGGAIFNGPKNSSGCSTRIVFDDNYKTASKAKYENQAKVGKERQCGPFTSTDISITPLSEGTGDNGGGDGGDGDGGDKGQPVCHAGALGWAICPMIDGGQQVMKTLMGWVAGFLDIQPLSFKANDPTFTAWRNVLFIANIILVIAFLFIIFSQATSFGLNSYGIKKMLPKIIVAAILMNLSYYIAAIMIDITNIVGSGISGLLLSTTSGTDTANSSGALYQHAQGIMDNIFGAGAWLALGVGAIIALLAVGIVPSVIILLVVFLILAMRIALIILLTMISPLAFAAWVLPNTEKWFKKWLDLFIQMLVIYPVIMALFAGAITASSVVAHASDGSITQQIVALIILIVPLVAIPFVVKATSGTLDRIGRTMHRGAMRGADSKAGQAIRQRGKNYAKFGALTAGRKIGEKMPGDPNNPGPLRRGANKMGRGYRNAKAFDKAVGNSLEARKQGKEQEVSERAAEIGVGTGVAGRALSGVGGSRYDEIVAAQTEKALAERVKTIQSRYDSQGVGPSQVNAELARALDPKVNDHATAAAAIAQLTSAGGVGGRKLLHDTLTSTSGVTPDMQTVVNNAIKRDNYSSLVGKRGDVAKGSFDSATGQYTTGAKAISSLGTEQLASQDPKTLEDNFTAISQTEAQDILANPSLTSKISNSRARQIFKARANGQTTLPPAGGTPPAPGPVGGGGGGSPTPGGGGGGGTAPAGGGGGTTGGGSPGPASGGGAPTGGAPHGGGAPAPSGGSPTSGGGTIPHTPPTSSGTSAPSGGTTPASPAAPSSGSVIGSYSPADIKSMDTHQVGSMISTGGGVSKLSSGDIAKLADAIKDNQDTGMKKLFNQLHDEQTRRMRPGGLDDNNPPGNFLG